MTKFRTLDIDGLPVFFREAGDRNAPAIVLMHGYPTSSHMFRDLIPLLADRFHVIAPDMIGFGASAAPSADAFTYSFDALTSVTRKLLERLEVTSYVLYMHDYGGPIGLRLATAAPERVRGLVVQNANAYMEGVSEAVAGLFMPLWKEKSAQTIAAARGFLSAEATKMQYTAGAHDVTALDPSAWTLDQAYLDRPGVDTAQLALFSDYEKNVALYGTWHTYFRTHQPRTLVVWGKSDPFFLVPGAEAYRRDLPEAEVVLLDGGHFALEEHAQTIAAHIHRVFGTKSGVEIAQGFYDELAAGRLEEALARLSPDVSWNDPDGFPYGGRLTGPAAVKAEVFARIAAEWAPFEIKAERVTALAGSNDVLAVGRYIGKHKQSGRTLDVRFWHLWSITRGLLTRFETQTDTATMHKTMAG